MTTWLPNEIQRLCEIYPILTSEECATELKKTRQAVKAKAKKLGLKSSKVKKKYRQEELTRLVNESYSMADLARKIGKNSSGTSYDILRKYINNYGIDISHFYEKPTREIVVYDEKTLSDKEYVALYRKMRSVYNMIEALGYNRRNMYQRKRAVKKLRSLGAYAPIKAISLLLILVQNSTHKLTPLVKNRIVEQGVLKYECKECGNDGMWMNKPITLQIDHINGINTDHRRENLRFLCPNCHTQTMTYGAKNQAKCIAE